MRRPLSAARVRGALSYHRGVVEPGGNAAGDSALAGVGRRVGGGEVGPLAEQGRRLREVRIGRGPEQQPLQEATRTAALQRKQL